MSENFLNDIILLILRNQKKLYLFRNYLEMLWEKHKSKGQEIFIIIFLINEKNI